MSELSFTTPENHLTEQPIAVTNIAAWRWRAEHEMHRLGSASYDWPSLGEEHAYFFQHIGESAINNMGVTFTPHPEVQDQFPANSDLHNRLPLTELLGDDYPEFMSRKSDYRDSRQVLTGFRIANPKQFIQKLSLAEAIYPSRSGKLLIHRHAHKSLLPGLIKVLEATQDGSLYESPAPVNASEPTLTANRLPGFTSILELAGKLPNDKRRPFIAAYLGTLAKQPVSQVAEQVRVHEPYFRFFEDDPFSSLGAAE